MPTVFEGTTGRRLNNEAMRSGFPPTRVARTLMAYRTGLLTYFEHKTTNAPVEGLVDKIKTLERQAYGYREWSILKLRLYHLYCQIQSLTG